MEKKGNRCQIALDTDKTAKKTIFSWLYIKNFVSLRH